MDRNHSSNIQLNTNAANPKMYSFLVGQSVTITDITKIYVGTGGDWQHSDWLVCVCVCVRPLAHSTLDFLLANHTHTFVCLIL